MTRCAAGRRLLSEGSRQERHACTERCVPDSVYCAQHRAEAMQRVSIVKGGDQPRRWTGGWMVSGTSRD